MEKSQDNKVKNLIRYSLFTSILAVLSMITLYLPISPIPITLQTLGFMVTGFFLKGRKALFPAVGYIFLGAVGLPVFSGLSSGVGHLFGPTGGFILGFLPATLFFSLIVNKAFKKRAKKPKEILLVLLASFVFYLVLYFFGMAWYVLSLKASIVTAFYHTVAPFILLDFIKTLIFFVCYNSLKPVKLRFFYLD